MKHTIDLGALLLISFATYTAVYAIISNIIYNAKKRIYNRQIKQLNKANRRIKHIAQNAEFVALATAYATNTMNYCINCGQALDWSDD